VGFGLVCAWALGLFELLANPEETAAMLRSMGGWGYLLYVASFSLLAPFFVPGAAFVLPAAMIWPRWLALVLSLVGAAGAGAVGFAFARFLARDWVEARIPSRLRRWDDALATRPIRTVATIRVLFMFLPPAHWALGISGVRFGPFVVGTVIGLTPLIVVLTWVGSGMMEWLFDQPPEVWWTGVGCVAIVAIVYRSLARRRQRRSMDAVVVDRADRGAA
jgi:uncharacterized membrane protein YdjX (TVP38/TMEM64 family)